MGNRFISSQGSNSPLWTPWHDVKTDPGSLIKSLNLNPRLKLAPSYTICLFYFTRHKEPRSHLTCPSQWFFHLQPLNCCWQPAKDVPISSFCLLPLWWGWCLCGQNSWKARLWGAMGKWAEKRNSFNQPLLNCNQVQACIGFAMLEASQGTKPIATWDLC